MSRVLILLGCLGLAGTVGCGLSGSAPGMQPMAVSVPDSTRDRPTITPAGHLPPVPVARGPLAIKVVYPSSADRVVARDSSFIFGSVGSGDVTLTVNGQPVAVWPNGAWIGWVALPRDSVMDLEITARNAVDSTHLSYTARRSGRFTPPQSGVWIDPASVSPQGRIWWPAGELLPLSVRAAEGARVRAVLPGGQVIPFVTDPGYDDVSWGIRAFDRDTTNLIGPLKSNRYVAAMRAHPLGRYIGPLVGEAPTVQPSPVPSTDSLPIIEAILGADTVRAPWPIRIAVLDSLPFLIQLDDDTARTGQTDGITVGRAVVGGTYHWFFPTGTRALVSGRINNDLRLQLSRGAQSWISAADAQPLPAGMPPLVSVVGSTTLTPMADRVSLRIPMSQRVPFEVTETERGIDLRIYSAVGDVNWIRYGGTDPLVRTISWSQPTADEVTLNVDLRVPVWGYRTRWKQNDLILEIRRPPVFDNTRPFRGLRIEVDPGHPPLGATGPTGLREAEANLAVALILRDLLQQAGAEVIMTRTTDVPVDLYPRVKLADSLNVDLLVSIHNNALPDGVNPFTNNGTSVFYNHPQSVPLAMAVQRGLVQSLGLRDLGVGRGDLALVRPTWMPAILCEGLFMMMPDQENALRDPEGQRLYAQGVFNGVERFLRERTNQK
ncbi:MAG: N-acetylmuramoyl-L-alanine amidase [Gemmatimonadota bacterium]